MWIPLHLDELDADFRVFYRIDGIADGEFGDLSAERFVALAEQAPCYRGSIRAIAEREAQDEADGVTDEPIELDEDRDDIEVDETELALTDLPMEAI